MRHFIDISSVARFTDFLVDPEATKPDDWDESEPRTIVDEDAEMPDGWLEDEPDMVSDPGAEKPDDWDDDLDGEWEPPLVDNPKCADAPGKEIDSL